MERLLAATASLFILAFPLPLCRLYKIYVSMAFGTVIH